MLAAACYNCLIKNPNYPKHLKLCRMGSSLYLTIPREFVLAHTLNAHDDVFWQPESDGIKLKFLEPHDPSPQAGT